jgi:hypothetical protein
MVAWGFMPAKLGRLRSRRLLDAKIAQAQAHGPYHD